MSIVSFKRTQVTHIRELYSKPRFPRGMRRYRSPTIVGVIKSRKLRWACYVARMEEGRSPLKILTVRPTGKRPLGSLGVDGRTILEWTLKK